MSIKIEHVHGDVIEAGGVKNVTQNFYDGTRPQEGEDLRLPDEDEEILDQLAPIFFGIREDAAGFLGKVRTMKSTQITQLVERLVTAGTISDKSYRRDLWRVLHDHGLYKRSETNWNNQINPTLPPKK